MASEVELVVLRQQLKILKRQIGPPSLRRRDRVFMAAISRVLPRGWWSSFLGGPQTLLRWHRELVRRKWTFRRRSAGGRPPIPDEVQDVILRMGRENPRWGCFRIRGELAKLGIGVSATKIRTLLRANGIGPAPRRAGPTWSELLRSQAQGIFALTSSPWRRSFERSTCCPRANAFAERWVRTVRMECLDWMLVFGRRHLEPVLRAYVIHYKGQAPSGPRPADARAGGGSASEADSPAKGPNAPSPGRAYP